MEIINLVFAINNKFLPPLAVTLQSIFETNRDEIFDVFVLTHNLSEEDKSKLRQIFDGKKSNLTIIDVEFEQFRGLPHAFHLDLSCYFRLAIPTYIERKKALYLDADLIIRGSLRPLWETNLDDYLLAAVPEFSANMHPELPIDSKLGYFNSGVMLLNLQKWREFELSKKVMDFSKENPQMIRFADQCGLNTIAKEKFLLLDPKYNFQGLYYETSYRKPKNFSSEEMESARIDAVIIHFTGTKKPWQWGSKHPHRSLYWKYLKQTPYKRSFPENPTPMNILRSIAPKGLIELCYNNKNKLKSLFS